MTAKYYLERYGKNSKGRGWYSFDHAGVHFIGLNNCVQLEGLGDLGAEQLAWLRKGCQGTRIEHAAGDIRSHSALGRVSRLGLGHKGWRGSTVSGKRFGSVTVLNGHIHQNIQKIEGNVTFHTAMSTAFPQPAPGQAPAPGPMKVPAGELRHVLGVTSLNFVAGAHPLAVIDLPLDGGAA